MLSPILIFLFVLGAVCNPYYFPINDLWKRNDKLLITLDFIYNNLAVPIENDIYSSQKRSFSIISQSIMNHVKKPDKTIGKIIKKTKKLMRYPADVIASGVRHDLDVLKAIIDQPINDIKKYCQPNTTSVYCQNKIIHHTALQTLECPFYPNHVELRKDLENLLLAEDFQNLLEDAIKTSVIGTDRNTLDFLKAIFSKKQILRSMEALYEKYNHDLFPCMYSGLFENLQSLICPDINEFDGRYKRNW